MKIKPFRVGGVHCHRRELRAKVKGNRTRVKALIRLGRWTEID